MKQVVIALAALVAASTAASAASPIKVATDSGDVIAGSNSYKTLYIYGNDSDGVSNCYDACAENWPPHLAEYWDDPRPPFATIERADGSKQWTKDGMPLYFSVLDKKKGETNGDGVDGVWQAARP